MARLSPRVSTHSFVPLRRTPLKEGHEALRCKLSHEHLQPLHIGVVKEESKVGRGRLLFRLGRSAGRRAIIFRLLWRHGRRRRVAWRPWWWRPRRMPQRSAPERRDARLVRLCA
jgi:hypothetical protein